MPLFQKSVITKYLKTQDKTTLTKKWIDFKNHFHNPTIQENIRNSKEEQYQEGFLRDLFVKILGYSLNPDANFNLTTEYKNVKDSKKADGAILIPNPTMGLNPLVIAVIELKGTNTTDLGKIETQAFGYKNNQPDCTYIITSNFEKLRFYIDNAIEHIEFNLFTLTEEDFDLLYLCLGFDNIAKNIAKKIKDESLSEEDVITKKLYKDYSLFKRELHQNLVTLNPDYEPLELFKKSQKLLDRFLFLFFGEDRHLLPPNSVRLILAQWNQLRELDEYSPLYDRFKKYFGYLNTGYKGKQYDVFAYNGGLFKPDEILDSIKINDDLLYNHTLKLSEYDFASEVDVNILGHIFENSLNELDEITNATMGLNPLAKGQTKRKKDGVFYTPKYITKYIVENTIGKLCEEKKAEINIIEEDYGNKGLKPLAKKTKQPLLEKLTDYRNWLLQLTICDPACGSGAFLNQALDFLIEEHRYIDELQAKLFGDAMVLSDVEKSILENNLFGVDLNEESVEIAKLSLWLRTAQPNRKLNDLNNNIKCGNSLIDDVEVAGDKAFSWQTAFPQVFKEKQKRPFHITTAIHDSRTSQRMIDYKVREKRAMGTMPEPQVSYLTDDDEMVIAETVSTLAKEQNLNILAFNVCKDHIHIVLVCEEEEVDEIVRKIKGRTAREVNINKGFKPLVKEKGEKSVPLWTQKFGCKEIVDENQLQNTIEYVKNNRTKHNLPTHSNKGFKPLVDSIACDYEHAFREEYKGGFDVIIGNPPYVNSKGLNFKNIEKEYYYKNYKTAIYQIDTYILFLEKIKFLLNSNGLASYIIPNSWLNNLFLKDVRKFVLESYSIDEIVNTPNGVFADATVDTIIITVINKLIPNNNVKISKIDNSEISISHIKEQQTFINNENHSIDIFSDNKTSELIEKIENKKNKLKEFTKIGRGVGVYHKRVGHTKEIIANDPYQSNIKKDETFVPYLRGKNIGFYSFDWNEDSFISYGVWLAEPREIDFFEGNRILLRQIPSKNKLLVTFLNERFIIDQSVFIARFIENNLSPKYILSLLGSTLMSFYFKNKYSEFDDLFPKVKLQHFKDFPIQNIEADLQVGYIRKVDFLLDLNKKFQELSRKFQRTLQRRFFSSTDDKGFKPLVDNDRDSVLPKKLQDWHLLSYGDFIKELGKKKVKLSLSQESEWEDYFIQEQKKAIALKTQIDKTDKEIDTMVYELYGLTEEEIGIIENS